MIKYSHEVPLCLLEDSRKFNTYDYCLPHLLDENQDYLEFFRKSKKDGRYIIMDNSLHELGKAYDSYRLLHWINELKPNEFIIKTKTNSRFYWLGACVLCRFGCWRDCINTGQVILWKANTTRMGATWLAVWASLELSIPVNGNRRMVSVERRWF